MRDVRSSVTFQTPSLFMCAFPFFFFGRRTVSLALAVAGSARPDFEVDAHGQLPVVEQHCCLDMGAAGVCLQDMVRSARRGG